MRIKFFQIPVETVFLSFSEKNQKSGYSFPLFIFPPEIKGLKCSKLSLPLFFIFRQGCLSDERNHLKKITKFQFEITNKFLVSLVSLWLVFESEYPKVFVQFLPLAQEFL